MHRTLILIAGLAVWLAGSGAILAQTTKIDLRTRTVWPRSKGNGDITT